jgi:hypothetical protein
MKTVLKKTLILSFQVFFVMGIKSFGQDLPDREPKVFFRNERTFSGSLVSNGWAANFRFARRIDAFSSYIIDADIAGFRHPKEIKSQSPWISGWGRSFVFGKLNEAFGVRGGFGYQKELFGKFDPGGISIRYFGSGGITLALLKPVYYKKVIGYNPLTGQVYWEPSPFDPDYMQSIYDIYEKQPFYVGIEEVRPYPGLFARMGLCFEYSSEDRVVNALEGGVQVEGFLARLPIMATDDNQRLFLTLFASYRFGKVIDARNIE